MASELKKTLGPVMIWALGVGYVISGMYFGWNLGLPVGGPYGFLVATLGVTVMYIAFVLGYAELACAMPKAGGAFVYGNRALGPVLGYLAGLAQWMEFVFAPPAIAAAIGAYFNLSFPSLSPTAVAIAAFVVFTGINIWGVRQSAWIELVITVLAIGELLLFAGVTAPAFSGAAFSKNPLPHGWSAGVFGSIPFAIWFYLAIEGVANIAEETQNPQKDLARGFLLAMATLVVLALLTFVLSVGVQGWEAIVYKPGTTELSDSPLPLALRHLVGESHWLYRVLISVGLCGLLASFHGILLCAGRATFEFGRMGYAPAWLGETLPGKGTPAAALCMNALIGILALLTGKTGEIITLAAFGAVLLYILSMVSLFVLRREEPELPRPFRTPLYPWAPGVALGLALISLGAMIYAHPRLGLVFAGMVSIGYLWYFFRVPREIRKSVLES
jgi:ethanolamine permease